MITATNFKKRFWTTQNKMENEYMIEPPRTGDRPLFDQRPGNKELVRFIEELAPFERNGKGTPTEGDIPAEWKDRFPDLLGKDVKLVNLSNIKDERVAFLLAEDRLDTVVNNSNFEKGMDDIEEFEKVGLMFNMRMTASKGSDRDRRLVQTDISETTYRQQQLDQNTLGFFGSIRKALGGK